MESQGGDENAMRLQDKVQLLAVEKVTKSQEKGVIADKEVHGRCNIQDEILKSARKTSWKRINSARVMGHYNAESIMRKRKSTELDARECDEEKTYEDIVKRVKYDGQVSKSKEGSQSECLMEFAKDVGPRTALSVVDHFPLLISTNNRTSYNRSPQFKFEAWWTLEESIEREIKKSRESSNGLISEKLERLQVSLTSWASSIKNGRDGLKGKLTKELGILMKSERDDDIMEKLIDTRIRLNMEIDKDEMYWEQRARANWLQLGDKDSAFFHKHASTRKRINTINRLESVEGQEIFDELAINEAASNYF
ncbi:hypothetical protein J1N35_021995 [Gossypium stocksii]|uniref:Uncharacterized protein n=1 Tax=Gossypium stocksii TaxID=47602 RepID=A0A9D3VHT6_9ROSI|nr:hypothetical protein J1N35_021995 [Gossypium stocksii]